ncbi:MAG: S-adenosylmethionine:tRNA ribosyltransferase-isomerase [Geodermatophilaceae bacterium]|jgi:S-adenosylmethionine:tRNA ribosyltransferase-isomerase|nr:S-adenosylmethionine:tRNA ribosyltransferase-isomerase [Geodermatophilaceae bacterium]
MKAGLACLPDFELPAGNVATSPPEARGIARDGVRMLVAAAGQPLAHRLARDLPGVLRAGDLVVVNSSDTLPAALTGVGRDGQVIEVHLSTVLPGGSPRDALADTRSAWTVEFRIPDPPASQQTDEPRYGEVVQLRGGGLLRVIDSYPGGRERSRLWVAEIGTPIPLQRWLTEHGQPIRYSYVGSAWPLSSYRTAYAGTPGSVEMPSAGRPLTSRLIRRLGLRGIQVADVVLHCGVSSAEAGEPPYSEWFSVPAETARAIAETRRRGRRVIAIGTTVVRALESAVDADETVHEAEGWTDLVITPDRRVSTVDGMLTGWHEPQASHLMMLEAVAGQDLLCRSYDAALSAGYRWHEFGDLHLLLP